MSLIKELESVEKRVLARLRELEPLVAEHRELSEIAARLGLDVSRADASTSRRSGQASARDRGADPAGRRAKAKPSGREASAARDQRVLAIVQATPGVTVAEVARQLDVAPSSLYRVVRKLTRERVLVKRGLALHPRK